MTKTLKSTSCSSVSGTFFFPSIYLCSLSILLLTSPPHSSPLLPIAYLPACQQRAGEGKKGDAHSQRGRKSGHASSSTLLFVHIPSFLPVLSPSLSVSAAVAAAAAAAAAVGAAAQRVLCMCTQFVASLPPPDYIFIDQINVPPLLPSLPPSLLQPQNTSS